MVEPTSVKPSETMLAGRNISVHFSNFQIKYLWRQRCHGEQILCHVWIIYDASSERQQHILGHHQQVLQLLKKKEVPQMWNDMSRSNIHHKTPAQLLSSWTPWGGFGSVACLLGYQCWQCTLVKFHWNDKKGKKHFTQRGSTNFFRAN